VARLIPIVVVAAVLFWVISVVDCALQPPARHRGVSKPVWIVIVLLLPVIGGVLWFWIGRGRAAAAPAGNRAPDDDPTFLGTIGGMTAAERAEQDERIRRLEEELARLDAEEAQAKPSEKPADPETPAPDGDDDSRGRSGARG
jgi:hypothetical protein